VDSFQKDRVVRENQLAGFGFGLLQDRKGWVYAKKDFGYFLIDCASREPDFVPFISARLRPESFKYRK
jgi:hypothetical protein